MGRILHNMALLQLGLPPFLMRDNSHPEQVCAPARPDSRWLTSALPDCDCCSCVCLCLCLCARAQVGKDPMTFIEEQNTAAFFGSREDLYRIYCQWSVDAAQRLMETVARGGPDGLS